MNEWREDIELLREFVRRGEQAAFAAVVRRHVDLVYATALRKVDDPGAAEEVAQNVFAVLARKAWQFASDDSLPAWLHRTTLLEARGWWRTELRRRRREQTAAELGTTMKTPDEQPALRALVPLLDEGLLSLREKDRAALLLRFYENQSLRDVGVVLGVNEDTAQKRVGSALERLVRFFQRRGFKTATAMTTAAVLRQTAVSAPAATSVAILQAATLPAATGLHALLARFAGITKIQTAAACAVLAVSPLLWQWHREAAAQRAATTIQTQLLAARADQQDGTDELNRLRQETARLDLAIKNAGTDDERAKVAQKLAAFKAKALAMLADTNGAWLRDSSYVRIPKSVITNLHLQAMFNGSGAVSDAARQVLGITAAERTWTEEALHNYLQAVEDLSTSHAYETNLPGPSSGRLTRTVIIPPLGDELRASAGNARDQLAATLGAEREQMLFGGWDEGAIQLFWPGNLWKISEEPQTLSVWVDPTLTTDNGPAFGAARSSGMGGTSGEGTWALGIIPKEIRAQFFDSWLRQHGVSVR